MITVSIRPSDGKRNLEVSDMTSNAAEHSVVPSMSTQRHASSHLGVSYISRPQLEAIPVQCKLQALQRLATVARLPLPLVGNLGTC